MADFADVMSDFVDGFAAVSASRCSAQSVIRPWQWGISMSRFTAICVFAALIGVPVAASAKSASNLRDLIGARAAGAERDLQRRGFFLTDGHKGSYSSYTYWWNPGRRDCVMVQTSDGRFASISDVSAADCNQQNHHGSSGTAAAAGVAVGALIGAAILAHKSGHHDDGKHYSDAQREAQYERGYRDGLHGLSSRESGESYVSGYRNGFEQRGRETSYQPSYPNNWGGGSAIDLNSLVGARAAGVESELQSKGFRSVDGFASGNTGRGSIWWNGRSRQCVQVITVDGRADSVVDIGTHPRCR